MPVTHLDLHPSPLADGQRFGESGPYEQLSGEASFAVDPRDPLNQVVTDLELAPRDADGHVRFAADLRILRPVARGNHGVLLDVVNRGASIFERMTEPGAMGPNTRLSAGWLLQRGYTVVSCGWQHDIPRGGGRFGLSAPEALLNGKRLSGRVSTSRQIDAPATVLGPFDNTPSQSAYAVLDPNEPGAALTMRDDPCGPARTIPRGRWRFARLVAGEPVADPVHVYYLDGFQPGKTYELSYTAIGAPVTGIGFLALRDVVSFLRFASAQAGNPCAGQIEFALAMGASQTGRLLRQLLYLGCCEDEAGRLVIDGLLSIAAGARMTEANWRFGQPSAQGDKSAAFPFTDAIQADPTTGARDGLLRRALERGRVPKVIHLNTSSEYVSSAAIGHISAALAHLSVDGRTDVVVPENVRIYHCASTQHAPSPLPLGPSDVPTGRGVYYANTIDYKPFVRAAIDNLNAWVREETPPPGSVYPRLADGTLLPGNEVRAKLPHLPGPGPPPRPHRCSPDLIAAIDEDGNEVSGIRHPDVSVPLATYAAWNPRHPETGSPELLVRATGATIPFARTREERERMGDPRASLAERYAGRGAFLDQVRVAAMALVADRYLLADDVSPIVEASARRFDEFSRLESPLPNT